MSPFKGLTNYSQKIIGGPSLPSNKNVDEGVGVGFLCVVSAAIPDIYEQIPICL